MKITVMTQDTRGGVQPYAALARALVEAGHEVQAVAPADLAWLFERNGVTCLALDGMPTELAREVALDSQGDRHGGLRKAAKAIAAKAPGWAVTVLEFAEGTDILTGGVGGAVLGQPVADALGVPWVPAHLQPVGLRNRAYPGVLMTNLPRLGGLGNLLGQALTEAAIRLPFQGMQKAARRALGARTRAPKFAGAVYGISPAVIRPPAGADSHLMAGYWFDTSYADVLAPEVLDFLAREPGRPVVSIGFGSMHIADPQALRATMLASARALGVRVVFIAGNGAVAQGSDDPDVLTVSSISHTALFPWMAVNVHHGGAGTSAGAFAAGVPSVIVPFGADQPFWALRASALGVAPDPIPVERVTQGRITEALRRALSDEGLRARSAEVGATIRAEDGSRNAAQWYGRIGL